MSDKYKKCYRPEKGIPSMVGMFSSGKYFLIWKITQ